MTSEEAIKMINRIGEGNGIGQSVSADITFQSQHCEIRIATELFACLAFKRGAELNKYELVSMIEEHAHSLRELALNIEQGLARELMDQR